MAVDPNLRNQIRNVESMSATARKNVEILKQQIKTLERQDRDAARLPEAGREQVRIRNQIRQCRRDLDRLNTNLKTFAKQLSELRRMAR